MSNKSAACKFITSKTTVIPKPGKFPDVDNKSVKSDTSGTDNIEDQKYQDKQAMPYDPAEPTDWDPRGFESGQDEAEAKEDGSYERRRHETREEAREAQGLDADHNKEWDEWNKAPKKWVEDDDEDEEKDAAALMQKAIKQAGKIDAQAGNIRDGYGADQDPDEDEEYIRPSAAVVDQRYAKRPEFDYHITKSDAKAMRRREKLEELRSEEQYGKKDDDYEDEEKDAAALMKKALQLGGLSHAQTQGLIGAGGGALIGGGLGYLTADEEDKTRAMLAGGLGGAVIGGGGGYLHGDLVDATDAVRGDLGDVREEAEINRRLLAPDHLWPEEHFPDTNDLPGDNSYQRHKEFGIMAGEDRTGTEHTGYNPQKAIADWEAAVEAAFVKKYGRPPTWREAETLFTKEDAWRYLGNREVPDRDNFGSPPSYSRPTNPREGSFPQIKSSSIKQGSANDLMQKAIKQAEKEAASWLESLGRSNVNPFNWGSTSNPTKSKELDKKLKAAKEPTHSIIPIDNLNQHFDAKNPTSTNSASWRKNI